MESDARKLTNFAKSMLSFEEKGILEDEGNEEGKWELLTFCKQEERDCFFRQKTTLHYRVGH